MSISDFPRGKAYKLGPATAEFTGADLAAAEASRDSYFSANPAKLAVYDSNSFYLIRLSYGVTSKAQGRLAGAWFDYTPYLQGIPGEVASLLDVPVGEIPYKKLDGTFGGSNMRVLEDGAILAPPGFTVESGSITFGEALTLSEVSGFLGISNHINGNLYTVVDFYTPPDAVSSEPHIFYLTAAETEFVAQATDTTNIPDNPLIFNYTIQNTARSHSLKFRTYGAMTNVRAKISLVSNGIALKYFPNRQAWEEGFGGMTWTLGDNVVPFDDSPLNLEAGMLVKFEVYADTVSLKGNASGIPYFSAMIQPGVFIDVITDNVYTASDIKSKLESLSSPNKLSKTAIQDGVLTVNGAFGAVTVDKAGVGLSNVDNTSDASKPVSTAQQTAIDDKMTAHLAAGDPHSQYTTTAEASAAAPVQSVNLLTGAVTLTTSNITEGSSLYYTDSRVQNYLTSSGYLVKTVASSGSGASVFNANTSGAVTVRAINGTGLVTVTQNANDITVSAPTLTSGTYTPALTSVTNILSSAAFQCQWMRVGTTVTVSGKITIDPSSNGAVTRIGMSIPVTSEFGAEEHCAGTSACWESQQSGIILADTTNNRAQMEFLATTSTIRDHFFTYTYTVI